MDLKEEQKLVAEAQHNPKVFGELYEEYYSGIFRYAYRRTGDIRTAEDITAETFYKGLKNLWKFRWQNIPFSAWLYRIASNEINSLFRKSKNKNSSLELLMESGFDPAIETELEDEIIDLETQKERHRDFLIILRNLKKLPVKYQEIIALRYFENKKIIEIATIVGKKEGTVKSLLSRGLDLLREEWDGLKERGEMQPFEDTGIVNNEGQENKIIPVRVRNR